MRAFILIFMVTGFSSKHDNVIFRFVFYPMRATVFSYISVQTSFCENYTSTWFEFSNKFLHDVGDITEIERLDCCSLFKFVKRKIA